MVILPMVLVIKSALNSLTVDGITNSAILDEHTKFVVIGALTVSFSNVEPKITPNGIVVAQFGITTDLTEVSPFIKTPFISIGVNVRFLYTTVSGITKFSPVNDSSIAYSLHVRK
jgi:hypothetical protein